MRTLRVAAALSLITLGRPGWAAEDAKFDLELVNTTWGEVGAQLSRLSGQPVIVDTHLAAVGGVNLAMHDVDLAGAVPFITELERIDVAPLPGGGVVIYRRDQAATPRPVTAVIRLQHVAASNLASWFGSPAVALTDEIPRPAAPAGLTPSAIVRDQYGAGRQTRSAATVPAAGLPILQVPAGIDSLVGNDLISAMVVVGQPDGIERLRELVAQFDVEPILIRVEATTLRLTPEGVQALQAASAVEPRVGDGSALMAVLAAAVLEETIAPLLADGRATVVQAVQMTTMNGQPATVLWQRSNPLAIVEGAAPEDVSVPQNLTVVPRLTGTYEHRSVTMVATARVAQVLGVSKSADGHPEPVVGQGTIQSTLRVRSGQVIVIGSATALGEQPIPPVVVMLRAEEVK